MQCVFRNQPDVAKTFAIKAIKYSGLFSIWDWAPGGDNDKVWVDRLDIDCGYMGVCNALSGGLQHQ